MLQHLVLLGPPSFLLLQQGGSHSMIKQTIMSEESRMGAREKYKKMLSSFNWTGFSRLVSFLAFVRCELFWRPSNFLSLSLLTCCMSIIFALLTLYTVRINELLLLQYFLTIEDYTNVYSNIAPLLSSST